MKKFDSDAFKGTTDFGGLVKVIVSKDIGAEMGCGLFILEPNEDLHGFEQHESDELFYIISGTLTVESPDKEPIEAHKNQVVWIPKNESHHSVNYGTERAVVFWCNRD